MSLNKHIEIIIRFKPIYFYFHQNVFPSIFPLDFFPYYFQVLDEVFSFIWNPKSTKERKTMKNRDEKCKKKES